MAGGMGGDAVSISKPWTLEVLDENRRVISSSWIMVDEEHAARPVNVMASVIYSDGILEGRR